MVTGCPPSHTPLRIAARDPPTALRRNERNRPTPAHTRVCLSQARPMAPFARSSRNPRCSGSGLATEHGGTTGRVRSQDQAPPQELLAFDRKT
jgi:hypothetical protein